MASEKKIGNEMQENIAGSLSYVLGIVTGIIFWAIRRNDEFVRFHAVQSIGLSVIWFAGWIILTIIPVIGWVLIPFWWLFMFVFWLIAIVKAYQGEKFVLPVVGGHIQRIAKQVGL